MFKRRCKRSASSRTRLRSEVAYTSLWCLSPKEKQDRSRIWLLSKIQGNFLEWSSTQRTWPNQQFDGVLCRFRRYPYPVACDVEKMFHQFVVWETDHDYLRFLWWPNGDIKQEPKKYRMKVHLFGAISLLGCPSYGFKCMDSQGKEVYPSAARICHQKNFL